MQAFLQQDVQFGQKKYFNENFLNKFENFNLTG